MLRRNKGQVLLNDNILSQACTQTGCHISLEINMSTKRKPHVHGGEEVQIQYSSGKNNISRVRPANE